jgi:hypothetical protein
MDTRRLPELRRDLEVLARSELNGYRIERSRIVVEPASGEVYELGEEEAFICDRLDGGTSEDALRAAFEERFGAQLDAAHLRSFVEQLGGMGLLVGRAKARPPLTVRLFPFLDGEQWPERALFHPGRLYARLAPWLRFWHTRAFRWSSAALGALALGVLIDDGAALWRELAAIVATRSPLWMLALFYLVINAPVVLLQGVAALHHGGKADELGVRFVFGFWPVLYTRIRTEEIADERATARVVATGIRYALFVASAAAVLWSMSPPALALRGFFACCFAVAAFNGVIRVNPLWATDASRWLAVRLSQLELLERALAFAGAWLARRTPPEPLSERDARLFRAYGLLAGLATFAAIGGALYLAALLVRAYDGLGALLVLALALLLYRRPLARLFDSAGARGRAA